MILRETLCVAAMLAMAVLPAAAQTIEAAVKNGPRRNGSRVASRPG
jgi:hypothetical protein